MLNDYTRWFKIFAEMYKEDIILDKDFPIGGKIFVTFLIPLVILGVLAILFMLIPKITIVMLSTLIVFVWYVYSEQEKAENKDE